VGFKNGQNKLKGAQILKKSQKLSKKAQISSTFSNKKLFSLLLQSRGANPMTTLFLQALLPVINNRNGGATEGKIQNIQKWRFLTSKFPNKLAHF
jgi:hypothetical protein